MRDREAVHSKAASLIHGSVTRIYAAILAAHATNEGQHDSGRGRQRRGAQQQRHPCCSEHQRHKHVRRTLVHPARCRHAGGRSGSGPGELWRYANFVPDAVLAGTGAVRGSGDASTLFSERHSAPGAAVRLRGPGSATIRLGPACGTRCQHAARTRLPLIGKYVKVQNIL